MHQRPGQADPADRSACISVCTDNEHLALPARNSLDVMGDDHACFSAVKRLALGKEDLAFARAKLLSDNSQTKSVSFADK